MRNSLGEMQTPGPDRWGSPHRSYQLEHERLNPTEHAQNVRTASMNASGPAIGHRALSMSVGNWNVEVRLDLAAITGEVNGKVSLSCSL